MYGLRVPLVLSVGIHTCVFAGLTRTELRIKPQLNVLHAPSSIEVRLVQAGAANVQAPAPAVTQPAQLLAERVQEPAKEPVEALVEASIVHEVPARESERLKPIVPEARVQAVAPTQPMQPAQTKGALVDQMLQAIPVPVPTHTQGTQAEHLPKYIENPAPRYPWEALQHNHQGTTVLVLEVLPSGRCGRVDVKRSSGYTALDQAALRTVKRWRFRPATRLGRPVTFEVEIPIVFELK